MKQGRSVLCLAGGINLQVSLAGSLIPPSQQATPRAGSDHTSRLILHRFPPSSHQLHGALALPDHRRLSERTRPAGSSPATLPSQLLPLPVPRLCVHFILCKGLSHLAYYRIRGPRLFGELTLVKVTHSNKKCWGPRLELAPSVPLTTACSSLPKRTSESSYGSGDKQGPAGNFKYNEQRHIDCNFIPALDKCGYLNKLYQPRLQVCTLRTHDIIWRKTQMFSSEAV